ncbi:hypothetical protein BDY21DRAFT_355073 [Lineolata rhizophorae]|uniref:Secreted protein n=1 Tax=Lineolata rhizophorae TaxID=578093 RepID=A0A6A6NPY0_9PEZI|nr:hypothetical protein BDY21DRAFT_355073 [Lineolata rhizophorae]
MVIFFFFLPFCFFRSWSSWVGSLFGRICMCLSVNGVFSQGEARREDGNRTMMDWVLFAVKSINNREQSRQSTPHRSHHGDHSRS